MWRQGERGHPLREALIVVAHGLQQPAGAVGLAQGPAGAQAERVERDHAVAGQVGGGRAERAGHGAAQPGQAAQRGGGGRGVPVGDQRGQRAATVQGARGEKVFARALVGDDDPEGAGHVAQPVSQPGAPAVESGATS
jgi:hypothetical protein